MPVLSTARKASKKKWCSVEGCHTFSSNPAQDDDVRQHKFPGTEAVSKEWVKLSGNSDLLRVRTSALSSHYICARHFPDEAYKDRLRGVLRQLSLPSTNLPPSLSEEVMAGWGEARPFWRHPHRQPHFDRAFIADIEPELAGDFPCRCGPDFCPVEPSSFQPPDGLVCEDEPAAVEVQGPAEEEPPAKEPQKRLTVQAILRDTGCSQDPGSLKVARELLKWKREAALVRRKLEICQRRKGSLKALAKQKLVETIKHLVISETGKQILEMELKNLKKGKGRSWSPKDKCFAIGLFKRSPSTYRFLSSLLTLPCESTLYSALKHFIVKPGFDRRQVARLGSFVKKWSLQDRTCSLIFDEMHVMSGLYYDPVTGQIEGFEDFGHLGKTSAIAIHALTFMVRGVSRNFKFSLGFFFVKNSCPSQVLSELIVDGVKLVESAGMNVVASVSDQGPTNRAAINILRQNCEEGQYESVYEVNGKLSVHIFDMPHILKNIRNHLLDSYLVYGDKGQFRADWQHIIDYNNYDLLTFCGKSGLSHDHLYPEGRTKMRVKFAAQALSYSVASAMCSIYAASEGRALRDTLHTAKLISKIDLYFDLCNGPGRRDKPKVQRTAVLSDSLHHVMWPKMISDMKNWKYVKKTGDSAGKSSVPPCILGWIDNIRCFQRLWSQLSQIGFSELNLRNLNSDPIENMFSILRQCNGSNRRPTFPQFQSSYKSIVLCGKLNKGKNVSTNCAADNAKYLQLHQWRQKNSEDFQDEEDELKSIYVLNEMTILDRGQVNHTKFLKTEFLKATRQGPASQCNAIVCKLLKKSSCRLCKNSLVVDESENFNSDHLLTSNLMSGCDIASNAVSYMASQSNALRKTGIYASPTLINFI